MKVQYHETEGSKDTMLFDPSFEIDKETEKARIHATALWHKGTLFTMPEHRGSMHTELWFDPHSGDYISGKPHATGAMQLCWVKDSVFHVLRYKPKTAKPGMREKLKSKLAFWRR